MISKSVSLIDALSPLDTDDGEKVRCSGVGIVLSAAPAGSLKLGNCVRSPGSQSSAKSHAPRAVAISPFVSVILLMSLFVLDPPTTLSLITSLTPAYLLQNTSLYVELPPLLPVM